MRTLLYEEDEISGWDVVSSFVIFVAFVSLMVGAVMGLLWLIGFIQ